MDDERIPTLEEVGLTPDDVQVSLFDPTDCLTSPEACAVWLESQYLFSIGLPVNGSLATVTTPLLILTSPLLGSVLYVSRFTL